MRKAGATLTLERQIVFGALKSVRLYRRLKDIVCKWNPETNNHKLDFETDRYNTLWSFMAAGYEQFRAISCEKKDWGLPPQYFSAGIIDRANGLGITVDVATELTEELKSEIQEESGLMAELTPEMLDALPESEAFKSWHKARILEQTAMKIALQKQRGVLSWESLDALMLEAKQAASVTDGLLEKYKDRLFDAARKRPRPVPRYFVGTTAIATCGNLVAINGMIKVGKTAVVEAMLASTHATSDADCFSITSENPEGGAVIHLDTEQSLYDHDALNAKVERRAGAPRPPWFKSWCLTGLNAEQIHQMLPVLLKQYKQEFGSIHSLLIDGIGDVAEDVNDAKAVNALVAELHNLAIEYNCVIIVCLHFNPVTDKKASYKSRGHLGSQLDRKCETNLQITRDLRDERISILWSNRCRHAPILEKDGPRFAWSDSAGMHTTVTASDAFPLAPSKQPEHAELVKLFLGVFSEAVAPSGGLSHKDLTHSVQSVQRVSERTAKARITEGARLDIIVKNYLSNYELAPYLKSVQGANSVQTRCNCPSVQSVQLPPIGGECCTVAPTAPAKNQPAIPETENQPSTPGKQSNP